LKIKILGNTLLGNETKNEPTTLDNLIATITSGMDTDISEEYKQSVINNPEYVAANTKVTDLS